MSNDWVDVCIRGSLDTGKLLSRLDDPTVQGAWEDGSEVHLYWAEDQWNGERLNSVRTALSDLATARSEHALSVTRVPDQDWNDAWARSVKPLRISRLVIRPQLGTGHAYSSRHRNHIRSQASIRHRPPCDHSHVAQLVAE